MFGEDLRWVMTVEGMSPVLIESLRKSERKWCQWSQWTGRAQTRVQRSGMR